MSEDETLVNAQTEVADLFGTISEFWGFTRTQGRIFGLLYLTPHPLDQSAVRERLGISVGSASMTMHSLVEWGVLHQEGRLYRAETDLFQLITTVLRRRERTRVADAIERARALVASLESAEARGGDDVEAIRFARQRTQYLLSFFEMGLRFLDALVGRGPVHRILNTIARTTSRIPKLPKSDRLRDKGPRHLDA